MTAESILLRPLGPALARRVAMALAGVFATVLVLSWLALASLEQDGSRTGGASLPAQASAAPAGNLLPPAGVLAFRPSRLDGPLTADTLFDAAGAGMLASWSSLLRDHPGSRVTLTLSCADTITAEQQARIGAALVRLLSAGDINPHRVQLVLAPGSSTALSPGEFRLAIEMGRP